MYQRTKKTAEERLLHLVFGDPDDREIVPIRGIIADVDEFLDELETASEGLHVRELSWFIKEARNKNNTMYNNVLSYCDEDSISDKNITVSENVYPLWERCIENELQALSIALRILNSREVYKWGSSEVLEDLEKNLYDIFLCMQERISPEDEEFSAYVLFHNSFSKLQKLYELSAPDIIKAAQVISVISKFSKLPVYDAD